MTTENNGSWERRGFVKAIVVICTTATLVLHSESNPIIATSTLSTLLTTIPYYLQPNRTIDPDFLEDDANYSYIGDLGIRQGQYYGFNSSEISGEPLEVRTFWPEGLENDTMGEDFHGPHDAEEIMRWCQEIQVTYPDSYWESLSTVPADNDSMVVTAAPTHIAEVTESTTEEATEEPITGFEDGDNSATVPYYLWENRTIDPDFLEDDANYSYIGDLGIKQGQYYGFNSSEISGEPLEVRTFWPDGLEQDTMGAEFYKPHDAEEIIRWCKEIQVTYPDSYWESLSTIPGDNETEITTMVDSVLITPTPGPHN